MIINIILNAPHGLPAAILVVLRKTPSSRQQLLWSLLRKHRFVQGFALLLRSVLPSSRRSVRLFASFSEFDASLFRLIFLRLSSPPACSLPNDCPSSVPSFRCLKSFNFRSAGAGNASLPPPFCLAAAFIACLACCSFAPAHVVPPSAFAHSLPSASHSVVAAAWLQSFGFRICQPSHRSIRSSLV